MKWEWKRKWTWKWKRKWKLKWKREWKWQWKWKWKRNCKKKKRPAGPKQKAKIPKPLFDGLTQVTGGLGGGPPPVFFFLNYFKKENPPADSDRAAYFVLRDRAEFRGRFIRDSPPIVLRILFPETVQNYGEDSLEILLRSCCVFCSQRPCRIPGKIH